MVTHRAAARRRPFVKAVLVAAGLAVVIATASAQEQAAIYMFAVDQAGTPLLDIPPGDIAIKEDVGASTIVSVRRFGWPLRVTVLIDNGPRAGDALVHYRTALHKFFAGLPPAIPVSLIATAPNPRWLIRETTDRTLIEKGVNLLTIDDGLGRFSDALIEYTARLDSEFRKVEATQLPPYLPILVSIASTDQDGSEVRRDATVKMIELLRKHRVWTNMIMVAPAPGRTAAAQGGLPAIESNEGQNAQIAKTLQEFTGGRYVPVTGSGTSGLSSSILPDLARDIALRYIRQMTQHRIVFERPAGASGPMKNFALSLRNHAGAKIVLSTDGAMP
jgi:hypothetical protein